MFEVKVIEKIKSQILCSITFFFENPVVYEIMWRNIVELDRPQMTIWHTRLVSWITKATNTYSEHVILFALPQQKWLHERPSMLRYTYIACIVLHSLSYRLLQRVVLVEMWRHITNGYTGGNTRMMINTENQNKFGRYFFYHDFHMNSSGDELENSQWEAKHGIIKIYYNVILKRYWNSNI